MAKNIKQVFENKMGQAAILPASSYAQGDNKIPDFDDILNELLLPKSEEDKKEYILLEIKVDQFTTIRKRKLITETTCRECGFDILEHFNTKNHSNLVFSALEDQQKLVLVDVLKKHNELMHPLTSKKIISESEMLTFNELN